MSPTYDADDDTPRTYASTLASVLAELKQFDATPFDPGASQFPSGTIELKDAVEEAFGTGTGSAKIVREGDVIVVEYPNPDNEVYDSHVSLSLAYKPNGQIKVLYSEYSNGQDNPSHLFYIGYIEDYDLERAFELGVGASKNLFADYIRTGLSPTQALDFGMTVGLGYPFHSWQMRRGIGYEGARKNRADARDALRENGWESEITERDAHVGRCGTCGRNMQTADSCDKERTLVHEDGSEYTPVTYGEERRYTDEEYRQKVFKPEVMPDKDVTERCMDCNIATGNVHHNGCDWEECPKCGLQLLSCDCDWATTSRTIP